MMGFMSSLRTRRPLRRILLGVMLLALVAESAMIINTARAYIRLTPVYDPPVLAGQMAPELCSGGFYARRGEDIVLTTSAHCGTEGQTITAPDGTYFGVLGPSAKLEPCKYTDRNCASSDMNYITVDPGHIPWGHLNKVDFGAGGYRVIAEGAAPLTCDAINIGDKVELNGLLRFRDGTVIEKGENDFPNDTYFPCIVATNIDAQIGDSGGAVLVNGLPAGITARQFSGKLAFTTLGGLAELDLELCTTPDCGLTPPTTP